MTEYRVIANIKGPKGDPGLPGVNAVPADSAVGTYVGTPGTNTRTAVTAAVNEDATEALTDPASDVTQAAAAWFPVIRLWDPVTETYPERVEGAKNIFVGPEDPGLFMDPTVDLWETGEATSLPSVIAEMLDPSSALYAATQIAATANRVPLTLAAQAGSTLERIVIGSSPNRAFGWKLPPSVSNIVFAGSTVPAHWENVRVRVRWAHTVGSPTGNVRLGCDITPYADGVTPAGVQLLSTVAVPAALTPEETVFTGSAPVIGGGGVTVGVFRLGSSGSDTFTGDIVILDAALERQA